jgi:type I restriction enzyme S subunit
MTPQELKNSILQLAIQGKLVEQRPEEGTGEELYQQIQEEKQRLINKGTVRKEKALQEITEDEKPFDIPESWKWVRLGEAITLLSGTDFIPEEYNDLQKGVPYITGASSLSANGVLINRWTETPRVIANRGDVLLVCKGSGYGKTVICDIDKAHIARQIMAIKRLENLHMKFNKVFLDANLAIIKSNGQGVIPGIDRGSVLNMAFPLPPLAEQKRIVAKIEELLPYIDRYGLAWSKLEDFNKHFPTDMQKSILQLAIQGKLVEQRLEEGTGEDLYQQIQAEKQRIINAGIIKKEKTLSEITEDEKPYDIPESWKWVRWGEVINIVSARRVHQSDWKSEGIPFYRAREIAKLAEDGYVDNELYISQDLFDEFSKSGVPQPGDLMVTAVGTLGKTYIVKPEDHFYYKDASVICFENYSSIVPEYLKFVMKSEMMMNQIRSNSSGTTVATLTMIRMVEYLLPLPPLAEQKRIVSKLEEILPLCEKLKK